MQKRTSIIFIIDLVLLTGSFLLMALYKPATARYLSDDYLIAFASLAVVWSAASFYFKKFSFRKKHTIERFVRAVLLSNFVSIGVLLVFITLFWISGYSRLMLFGTIGLATLLELVIGNIYFSLIKTRTITWDVKSPPVKPSEIKAARDAVSFSDHTFASEEVKRAVEEECGPGVYEFMCEQLDVSCENTLIISTSSRFNIEMQPDGFYRAMVNMKRVNDLRYINKFFESVNRKLPYGGTFIGCAETKEQRKRRILRKYPPVLNWLFYVLDYLLKRVFPKFILTRKIYYLLTRGQNRVLSRAELLGRLCSCGFGITGEKFINGLYCYAVQKVREPEYDLNPTYGIFVKLQRVGRGGKIIRVYKLRTMHPYSEYLQNYVFEKNKLGPGGKYNDDFRVTTMGKLMRALWIDELPMIFNLLKGEVKPVGVRPLSPPYFALYDKDLRERRIRYRPGLIPPFYADMPETLVEIQDSERRYFDAWDKSPFLTDLKYFFRAAWNILFRRARSR